MAKIDKAELEKLTPAEKIKRLKKLEEENKQEIEEAGKLIKETESKLEREKILESVAVPQTKPINIDELFHEEKSLESTVKKEAPKDEKSEEGTLYQLAQAYEEAKDMLYSSAPLSQEQASRVDKLGERIEKIRYYSASDQVANLAVATKTLIHKIKKYQLQ
ncbi:MAG: hypothetical protein KKC75_04225 [Nanoarchaeota archaeon]|nr:hypothetical protein [Nanoarchaeota archaeon]MBU1005363.1 hypothetical protein [Nanoarchaeota archaeon]MBU1946081.1 hypothetical protein [Nanoarchaeota archaeon]